MSERRRSVVTWNRGASGIEDIESVLKLIKADVGVTVEDDIAVVFSGFVFDVIKGEVHAVAVTVSGKDLVTWNRQNKVVIAHTVVIAVSGNVDYLRSNNRMLNNKSVELRFSVAKVEDPVGVGVPENNFFQCAVIAVGIGHNNNSHKSLLNGIYYNNYSTGDEKMQ